MQSVCLGMHTGVSAMEMLSIEDLNTSDENCIHSTLIFLINQAKSLNIPMPIVTFDQTLHIKTGYIALEENLNIIICKVAN